MESLRVKNFRSIKDSGEIQIKPISIFLGKNSCGKSSFMRLLPLLKQTLESDVNEPLLWYGDYVDFGDFKNVLPRNTGNNFLELSFNLQVSPYKEYYFGRNDQLFDVTINLKITEKYIKEIEISYFDQCVNVIFNLNKKVEKITINGDIFSYGKNEFVWGKNKNVLIPSIYEKSFPKQYTNNIMFYYYYYHHTKEQSSEFLEEIKDIMSTFTSSGAKEESRLKLFRELSYIQSKETLLKKISNQKMFKLAVKYFNERNINDETFIRLNNLIVFDQLNFIIDGINNELNQIFENTYYLKPIRVNAERYYRIQGIRVNKVDADGSNLPMIFYNMGEYARKEFEDWCFNKFGLYFTVETTEGHVSIIVEDKEGYKSNLVDTGYGFSQVLPIIVQLWLLKYNRPKRKQKTDNEILLVIEQPELHLHPAFQAKLMEVFVALIQEMYEVNIKFKIVFETHSEAMINRLGYLISQKGFNKDLVNVILVEKENQNSKFKQVGFTEEGYIEHWPIGFMSAED